MNPLYYPDQFAMSPSGRFIVEAASPGNRTIFAKDGSRPDSFGHPQSNFRYRVKDATSGKTIWERWQLEDEGPPTRLRVSDEGWAVIWTDHWVAEELIAISPSGEKTCSLVIEPEANSRYYEQEEKPNAFHVYTDYMLESTEGIYWEAGAHQFFWNHDGLPTYVILTGWGEQIFLDLEAGNRIELSGVSRDAFESWERQRACMLLKDAAEHLVDYPWNNNHRDQAFTKAWSKWDELTSMLGMAIRLNAKETAPYMHAINKRSVPEFLCDYLGLPEDLDVRRQEFRRLTKLALRLFEEIPQEYACYTACRWGAGGEDEIVPFPECMPNRDNLLWTLNPGMHWAQVLQTVGLPDYVPYPYFPDESASMEGVPWEYFYGLGNETSSLRITWVYESDEPKMAELRRIEPLNKQQIDHRVTMILTSA